MAAINICVTQEKMMTEENKDVLAFHNVTGPFR